MSIRFGRKSLIFVFNAFMAFDLLLIGVFSQNQMGVPMLISLMLFICAFEFSSGPIVWLYMAEIMQDKAVSVATVLGWIMNLLISLFTPMIVKLLGEE